MKRTLLRTIVIALTMATSAHASAVTVRASGSADTPYRNSTEHLAQHRAEGSAWQLCAKQQLFGEVTLIDGQCEIYANIDGFDGRCDGLYECAEGEPQIRLYFTQDGVGFSYTLSVARKVAEQTADGYAAEYCDKHNFPNPATNDYGYWYEQNVYGGQYESRFVGYYFCRE